MIVVGGVIRDNKRVWVIGFAYNTGMEDTFKTRLFSRFS